MRPQSYNTVDLRTAYREIGKLKRSDDCNLCGVAWGTMHDEACQFFKVHDGTLGHSAEVVARFIRCVNATPNIGLMVNVFIEGMRRCKETTMSLVEIDEVLKTIHEMTEARE